MKKYYDCEDFDARRFEGSDIESTECLRCCKDRPYRRGFADGNGCNGDYDYDYDYPGDRNCGGCQMKFKSSLRHLIGVTVRLFMSNETVITGIILCVAGDEIKVLERTSDRVILVRDKEVVYVEEPRYFPQF